VDRFPDPLLASRLTGDLVSEAMVRNGSQSVCRGVCPFLPFELVLFCPPKQKRQYGGVFMCMTPADEFGVFYRPWSCDQAYPFFIECFFLFFFFFFPNTLFVVVLI